MGRKVVMMQKQIGNIILDYTYYKGQDLYSDGVIEDTLLDIVKNSKQKDILYSSSQWPILYHLSDMRENLLEWYSFRADATILEIGSGCGALTGLLSRKAKQVTCIELSEKRSLINAYQNKDCDNIQILLGNFQDIELKEKYDYITLIGVWEYAGLYVEDKKPYIKMLEIIQKYLKKDGKIIIAIENKMGLKYWNGAPEDHTGTLYSGLNDYIGDKGVRTFSKPEIENILKSVGIPEFTFYYPMPDYKLPETIYSDEFLPVPGTERNYGKDYNSCRIYNFNDAATTDQICNDRMFSYFANSFLIVTGENYNQTNFEKYNRCRKSAFRIKTELFEKEHTKYVRKIALNEAAKEHVFRLKDNEQKWIDYFPNIIPVKGYMEGNDYVVPYIDGVDLDTLFYDCRHNSMLFIEKFCYFTNKYLKPDQTNLIPFTASEKFISIFGNQYPSNQMALSCTNIDMIFSNLKLTSDEKLYCFDYEWVFEFPIPYEYMIWRSASQLYIKYMTYLMRYISKEDFLTKAGISNKNLPIYEQMEKNFYEYVYGENTKEDYLKNYRKGNVRQSIRIV